MLKEGMKVRVVLYDSLIQRKHYTFILKRKLPGYSDTNRERWRGKLSSGFGYTDLWISKSAKDIS